MRLIHGDCLEVLSTFPSGNVDMVCADPPYGTTACKWDSVIPLVPLWEQLRRVVKPNGAVVLTASQPFTSALVMSNRRWFRYCWVWEKENGTDFLNTKRKPFEVHEDVCVFYERQPTYNPQATHGAPYRAISGKAHREWLRQPDVADGTLTDNNGTRVPRTVLRMNVEKGLHPTQKPVGLMSYLIRTYTNEGETILDFCMGSGTTGVACAQTGRDFIGIEKDPGYFAIAEKRIGEAQNATPLFPETVSAKEPTFQFSEEHPNG